MIPCSSLLSLLWFALWSPCRVAAVSCVGVQLTLRDTLAGVLVLSCHPESLHLCVVFKYKIWSSALGELLTP